MGRVWKFGPNFGLREQITYHPAFYYFVVTYNLVARYTWSIVVIWDINEYPLLAQPFVFGTMLMSIDLLRRFFWALIRLENEQINNPLGFRQILEIPEINEHDEVDARVEEKKYAQIAQRIRTVSVFGP